MKKDELKQAIRSAIDNINHDEIRQSDEHKTKAEFQRLVGERRKLVSKGHVKRKILR